MTQLHLISVPQPSHYIRTKAQLFVGRLAVTCVVDVALRCLDGLWLESPSMIPPLLSKGAVEARRCACQILTTKRSEVLMNANLQTHPPISGPSKLTRSNWAVACCLKFLEKNTP